jgi:flagellar biosynthesis/type III secretory pathway protein FliH
VIQFAKIFSNAMKLLPPDLVKTLGFYHFNTNQIVDMQHFQNIVNTIHQPSNADPSMKTLAQWFVEEGISKGISKGMSQGISKGRNEGELIGLRKGRNEGQMIGRILTLQEITGHAYIEPQKIADCSMEQLKETLKRLEADFGLSRRSLSEDG